MERIFVVVCVTKSMKFMNLHQVKRDFDHLAKKWKIYNRFVSFKRVFHIFLANIFEYE